MYFRFKRYSEYQRHLARETLIPLLRERNLSLNGKRVLDLGCGEGGVLLELSDTYSLEGVGIDYDNRAISRCQQKKGLLFEQGDILTRSFPGPFDLIIARDVIEHVPRPDVLMDTIAGMMTKESFLYLTYTPYASPFGGHQHNGAGFFSYVPYLQFLPEPLFLRLIAPHGGVYKDKKELIKDLRNVRAAHIRSSAVEAYCAQRDIVILSCRQYLIRPDYRQKFFLMPIKLPEETPFCNAIDSIITGVELFCQKKRQGPKGGVYGR